MASENLTKEINGKLCLSTSLMAQAFGVSKKTIIQWEKKGCPKEVRGYWFLPDVLAWQKGNEKGRDEGKPLEEMSLDTQKLFYETQLKKAQSENHELKNAITRGDYLEKAYVVEELERYFVIFKRSAIGLVSKIGMEIAPYVDQVEARRLENHIGEIVNDALEQFSVKGVYSPGRKKRS